MTDAEFEDMVRSALLEATRREYAHILEADDLPAPDYSPRFLRWQEKFLADPFGYVKRKARPLWKKVGRAAACLLVAAGVAFGGVLVFSPQARAWVAQVIAEWRETHTKFTFTGEPRPGADVGVWRPSYVPDGFEEIDRLDLERVGYIVYEDSDGVSIRFTYRLLNGSGSFSNDNEHSDYYQTTINGNPADLFISTQAGKRSFLIWSDEDVGTAYKLSSEIDYNELITMAESVEKIN